MSVTFESQQLEDKPNQHQHVTTTNQDFMRAIESRYQHNPSLKYQNRKDLQPISSQLLKKLMSDLSKEQLLIIDVRSFDSYAKSRIHHAIHISIPSILLKRPSFTIEKVCEAIDSNESKSRLLNHWHDALNIIFYDHSCNCNTTSILLGKKLRNMGYKGHLNYLQGGFMDFLKCFPDQCNMTKRESNSLSQTSIPSNQINPFFSNIRQNLELAHGPLKERFPIRLPTFEQGHHPRIQLDAEKNLILPFWLNQVLCLNTGTKKLAQLYEALERIELNRLSTVMNYHASHQDQFPLSITCSMEKGALNRYDNIWPYEYSRVKLDKTIDNYINANYIQFSDFINSSNNSIQKSDIQIQLENQGLLSEASIRTMSKDTNLKSTRPYICTQGPLPTTCNDFWKMVWDEHAPVIVMLTQECELNKMKCHRYWPSQCHTYGSIHVKFISEIVHTVHNANDKRHRDEDSVIIIRQFSMSCHQEERTITQLQYPSWTDFGVPDLPLGILELVHYADVAYGRAKQRGPMVVHCSAGCGRSGTFCVIDTMIQRLSHEKDGCMSKDKVFETISRFREQRMSLVQTHRQFVFCYEAIVWWLLGYGHLPIK